MPEIRHIKYVSASDLLFGNIVVWGNERLVYTHRASNRCHKRHMGIQLVESFLQWTRSAEILDSLDAKIATTLA